MFFSVELFFNCDVAVTAESTKYILNLSHTLQKGNTISSHKSVVLISCR